MSSKESRERAYDSIESISRSSFCLLYNVLTLTDRAKNGLHDDPRPWRRQILRRYEYRLSRNLHRLVSISIDLSSLPAADLC